MKYKKCLQKQDQQSSQEPRTPFKSHIRPMYPWYLFCLYFFSLFYWCIKVMELQFNEFSQNDLTSETRVHGGEKKYPLTRSILHRVRFLLSRLILPVFHLDGMELNEMCCVVSGMLLNIISCEFP